MARWLCNFSDQEIWKVFRSITELIYDWVEPKLPDKLLWYYYAIKPYIEDDVERHRKYTESKSMNWKLWGRPKASFVGDTDNPSEKPKKAKKAKKATDNDNDIYTNNIYIVYNNIDNNNMEELKKEFPNKNFDVEIKKMCNNWAWKWKTIKKPKQALRNWLLPKKWENDYIDWVEDKTDDQRISEFLQSKTKFYEKYWEVRYYEIKDKRISKCLSNPLAL